MSEQNGSNIVTVETALTGVLRQYHEGAITYAEFIMWILANIPPPCDNPETDKVYRCLYAGAMAAADLTKAAWQETGCTSPCVDNYCPIHGFKAVKQ